MNAKTAFFSRNRALAAFIVLAAAAFVISMLITLPLINGNLKGDYWRWTNKLLLPLINGEISFHNYLMGDYVPFNHSHFFTLSMYWLNYQYFGINLAIEHTIGLFFYYLTPFVFLVFIIKSSRNSDAKTKAALFLAVTLVFLNPAVDLDWNLVVLEYFYLFLAILFMYATGRYLNGDMQLSRYIALALVCFILGDVFATMAGLAIFSVSLILLPFWQKERARLMTAALVFAGINMLIFFADSAYKPFTIRGSKVEALLHFLQSPGELFPFFQAGAAQAFFNKLTRAHLGLDTPFMEVLAGAGLLVAALWLSLLWLRDRERNVFPIFLITFSLIGLAGVVLSRSQQFGLDAMYMGRYVRYFQPLLIGTLLLAFLRLRPRATAGARFCFGAAACCSALFVTAVMAHTNQRPFVTGHISNFRQDLLNVQNVHMGAPYCERHDCSPAWHFLKENQLAYWRSQHTDDEQTTPATNR